MKKLLSSLMILVLFVAAIAGLVSCGNDEGLADAKAIVDNLYKGKAETTGSDYDVVAQVKVGDDVYKVTWKVDVTEGVTVKESSKAGYYTIDVAEESAKDVAYKLTATITSPDGKKSVELSYNRLVPKFKVNTHAEYLAAKEGDNLVVEGIVVGINSKAAGNTRNHLFLADANGNGGYYIYQLEADPVADTGIALGMTVRVTGPAAPYSGMMEIKGGVAEIIDSTVKTVEPVDISEQFLAETPDYATYVGRVVTVKGVVLGAQELATASSQYLFFNKGAVKAYVRTYVTDFPTTLTADAKATIDALHASKYGYQADVTGILVLYSGAPYIIPTSVDCFTNFSEVERTPAEQVKFELDKIAFDELVLENSEFAAPAAGSSYADVVLSYVSDSDCAVVENGKIVVTLPDEKTTVKITVTATIGEGDTAVTESREFTFIVNAASKGAYLGKPEANPVAGVAYKFYLTAKDGQNYYFNGLISGKFLQTSTNAADGVDVFLEEVKNGETVTGYYFYFMDGETKTYITIADGKAALVTENPVAFNYVAETNSWTDGTNYLGTYNDFVTIGASKNTYIKPDNTGVSQFPANFATAVAATYVPENVKAPVAGVAYKFFLTAKDGKNYYFNGLISGKFLQTSTNAADGVDVYLEEVKNGETVTGYYIYFMDGETKTYITIADGKAALVTENPVALNYAAETNSWTDGTNYLGTYNDFVTIGASKNTYIKPDNTGVSQFPANFASLSLAEITAKAENAPAKDTAYKFFLTAKDGKNYYFNGLISGKYLQTTTDLNKAVDVFVEEVKDGETVTGYYIYFMDGETKTYITIADGKAALVTENPVALNYAAETNSWTDGTNYLGTYNDFVTIGASKNTYIKPDNTGVSQFPANFASVVIVEDSACTEHTFADATCQAPKTCTVCGATEGEPAAHTFADATCKLPKTCTVCKATEGTTLTHTYDNGVCTACGKGEKQADFATFSNTTDSDTSYAATRTNSEGWTITYGRCDEQADFGVAYDQIILNGKTTAVGTLTSAKLTGGIRSLSFGYGFAFTETNGVSLIINIKDAEGNVVATTTLVDTAIEKLAAGEFTWTLETAVEGEFVIEIVNASPSNSTSNKDRYSIWNLTWA